MGFAGLLLGGRIVSGADYFLDLLDFDRHLPGCDLVITAVRGGRRRNRAATVPASEAVATIEVLDAARVSALDGRTIAL